MRFSNIDLNDMMLFQVVAELKSFTKAADILKTPKSNLSRRVTRLENHLNVRLLERSTRSMHLTEVGHLLLKHCQRISEELEQAQHSLESLAAEPIGTLRVCTSVGVGQSLIAKHLAEFYRQFPKIKLDLKLSNRRVDILDEGFDVAIRVGESPDSNLISKKLFRAQFALFASPEYLKQHNKITTPADLHCHRCLHMSGTNSQPTWILSDHKESASLNIEPVFSVDDFLMIKTMLLADQGIALMPSYMCQHELMQGTLLRVLPHWNGRTVDMYAIYPSRKGMTPKLTAFIQFFSQHLAT